MNTQNIKAAILDYGATIDTNGIHWSEVMQTAYRSIGIPIERESFRNAYIHGERTLALTPLVKPTHNFWHVLRLKAEAQVEYLQDAGLLPRSGEADGYPGRIADWCYAYAQIATNAARPILKRLSEAYPLVIVTNFYGNMNAVLEDFHLRDLFVAIVESAVAGVRKPDPEIFRLGVKAAGFTAAETAVVGDSYDKDIRPASAIGCPTIWLRNTGWNSLNGDETADVIIPELRELTNIFNLQ